MKLSSVINFILTMLILIAGILLITGTAFTGDFQTMKPLFDNGIAGLLKVVIMTHFMFVGFDLILQAPDEINLTQRHIVILLIFSVILAVFCYVALLFG